jgi:cytochrome c553
MSCYGEKAAGNGPIPRLAGQHHAYLTRQVGSIRVHGPSEIMHENSKDLIAEQTSEVTAYLATL